MPNKSHAAKSKTIISPGISPEADPSDMPVIPLLPEEELDLIPDVEDELLETPPPDEEPEPGEGP